MEVLPLSMVVIGVYTTVVCAVSAPIIYVLLWLSLALQSALWLCETTADRWCKAEATLLARLAQRVNIDVDFFTMCATIGAHQYCNVSLSSLTRLARFVERYATQYHETDLAGHVVSEVGVSATCQY